MSTTRKTRDRQDSHDLRTNLASFVASRRRMLGITQVELAQRAGDYPTNINRLEGGQKSIDGIQFSSLASALEITKNDLWLGMVGFNILTLLQGKNIFPTIQAIAESGIEGLSANELLTLLQIGGDVQNHRLNITKEMVPGLLAQIRNPVPNSS